MAIVQPNIAKMLATFTAMFPKITKQTKQKKTIVILDFSTYTTDIEAIKANVMNTIKEAYIKLGKECHPDLHQSISQDEKPSTDGNINQWKHQPMAASTNGGSNNNSRL